MIFHSYVSLPEGTSSLIYRSWAAYCCDTRGCRCSWAVWTRALPRPETTTKNAVAPWRMGCGVLLANIKKKPRFLRNIRIAIEIYWNGNRNDYHGDFSWVHKDSHRNLGLVMASFSPYTGSIEGESSFFPVTKCNISLSETFWLALPYFDLPSGKRLHNYGISTHFYSRVNPLFNYGHGFKFANCNSLPEGQAPFSYGFPMIFPFSYGFPYGFPMVFPMIFPFSYGFPMVFLWFSSGFYGDMDLHPWFPWRALWGLSPLELLDFDSVQRFAEPWMSPRGASEKAS